MHYKKKESTITIEMRDRFKGVNASKGRGGRIGNGLYLLFWRAGTQSFRLVVNGLPTRSEKEILPGDGRRTRWPTGCGMGRTRGGGPTDRTPRGKRVYEIYVFILVAGGISQTGKQW